MRQSRIGEEGNRHMVEERERDKLRIGRRQKRERLSRMTTQGAPVGGN